MSETERQETPKRPPWRPTDYKPEFCERVIEWGRLGKSKAWMAAELGVAKSTLQLWEKVHPDFSAALSYAIALSQQWWEDSGQTGMTADKFNNGVWVRSMAARFPEDWRETTDQNVRMTVSQEEALKALE